MIHELARLSDLNVSFSSFERRANAGERLNVVFIGGSVTWGAGASDPNTTSYRALVGSRLKQAFPLADIRIHDAAIGGTGSQIGAFRLERDVLSQNPDLVFLEFTLNDNALTADIETLASYEAVLRRILESGSLVFQVMLPTKEVASTAGVVVRRDKHIELSKIYGTAASDVIENVRSVIRDGMTTADQMWPKPDDGAHPGDIGYRIFADAIWVDFLRQLRDGTALHIPPETVYASTYMKTNRMNFAQLESLPAGWKRAEPRSDSPIGDFVMTRWFDQVVVADTSEGPDETPVDDLCLQFIGTRAMLFAESTENSGRYIVRIDDNPAQEFDSGELARNVGSSGHHFAVLSTSLKPGATHLLKITPVIGSGTELRLESLCVTNDQ